ncbi:MAG: hypothetical protein OTI34_06160 [Lewinella sp.]|nr:hypothetical protein [Lewinella sp.]
MEVKVKIDKFGRVLIPKKIREAKGYVCGTELSLIMEPETTSLLLEVTAEKNAVPYVEITDWGWPVIKFPNQEKVDFDIVSFIKEGYKERSRKLMGE